MADDITDHQVVDAMLTIGGNFIRHLALAYQAADRVNQQRLKTAFADEWQQYQELVRLKRRREG